MTPDERRRLLDLGDCTPERHCGCLSDDQLFDMDAIRRYREPLPFARMKAEAWDEGKAAMERQADYEYGASPTFYRAVNPYRDEVDGVIICADGPDLAELRRELDDVRALSNARVRLLTGALNDAIRTLRELAEKAAGEPIPSDDLDLYAEVIDGALDAADLTDERDSLSWQVEALRAERDARSSERDGLAAKVERVRALHRESNFPSQAGTCNECDGWYPCETTRALDEEPQP